MSEALEIRVYGLVQGVGFRPFLHRLAAEHRLTGWALNTDEGVHLKIQGSREGMEAFLKDLRSRHPPLARIEQVAAEAAELEPLEEFRILPSRATAGAASRISPDIAVCDECLEDIFSDGRRRHYPFTNCTNCGPRFSIVHGLPYDRASTTMRVYPMCADCRREYGDITDRRYHAQPNACPHCGPQYRWLEARAEEALSRSEPEAIDGLLARAARLIQAGEILALKGIGGFHLVCNAADENAVANLRRRKFREGKPFAVMFRSLEAARRAVSISEAEERQLLAASRPIVLCRTAEETAWQNRAAPESSAGVNSGQQPAAEDGSIAAGDEEPGNREATAPVAPSVSRGLHTLGVMLPYAPIHHLLFQFLSADVLVMTSGNLSGEPLVYRNRDAVERLSGVADAFLLYDREIRNPSDDSVVFVAAGRQRIIRRSRGLVPDPLPLSLPAEGIVAGGGELKNCFALGQGRSAVLSQHIGDLANYDTLLAYRSALNSFLTMLRITPGLAAADMHPDYASGREMRSLGVPVVQVQHHHAHIASCMAEQQLEERVIGIAFDGTGYGDDGAVWGGEFLLCDLTGYRRVLHFCYLPLPGGDRAAEEPWRMALSWLRSAFSARQSLQLTAELCGIPRERAALLMQAMDGGTAAPPCSSVGRLFDAAAALLGVVQVNGFEAEAPMRLEALAVRDAGQSSDGGGHWYPFRIEETVRTEETVRAMVADIRAGVPGSRIARKFHRTIAEIAVAAAERIRAAEGLNTAVLSGGVFQNRLLLEMSRRRLADAGFRVVSNSAVPANDGGIALGQIAVAAAMRRGGLLPQEEAAGKTTAENKAAGEEAAGAEDAAGAEERERAADRRG
jgi:hydrogenase maturation protein HypF